MTQVQTDDTKIAVINTNIGFIQRDINDIKLALRDQYATREALVQFAKDTEARLAKLENASNIWKWLNPILAGTLGSVLTFLLIQYIMHAK